MDRSSAAAASRPRLDVVCRDHHADVAHGATDSVLDGDDMTAAAQTCTCGHTQAQHGDLGCTGYAEDQDGYDMGCGCEKFTAEHPAATVVYVDVRATAAMIARPP